MATKAKVSQTQRFIKFISQQIELLKEEQINIKDTVDDTCNQVQREVEAWVNSGEHQATCAKINHRIQQVIALFMAKTVEIADLENIENGSGSNETTLSHASTIAATNKTKVVVLEKTMLTREDTGHTSGFDLSHSTNTRFSILEDAVLSLKKTTEKIQEKQEHVIKRLDSLKNSNVKSRQKIEERLQVLEEAGQEISSNVDHLFESEVNFVAKLTSLEEENKSVSISINELDNKINSIGTRSNDASMSVQDIEKDLEDINKNYVDMSDEISRLKISLNNMPSHFTEELKKLRSHSKDKVEEIIGLVCQLFSKRLSPLEKLNDTLNKNFICSKEYISKVEAIDKKYTAISCYVEGIERQRYETTVGFNASKRHHLRRKYDEKIKEYDSVSMNHGSYFNEKSGNFYARLHGIYLISINLSDIGEKNGQHKIRCCQREPDIPLYDTDGSFEIFSVSENGRVTHLVELQELDAIYLVAEANDKAEHPTDLIQIEFSCCMIQSH